MSVLHTVNKAAVLDGCLRLLGPGDALLLIEDGVYAAVDNPQNRDLWQSLPDTVERYVLENDVRARGVEQGSSFTAVGDAGFVDLVCRHDKTLNWF